MALASDRRAVARAVRSLGGLFKVVWWEGNAYPGKFRPDELFMPWAARCDLLILLVGPTLTKNTKREYDLSVRNRRSQLVLFKTCSSRDRSAQRFRSKLHAATYCDYRNGSELRTLVIRALKGNVTRLTRVGQRFDVGTRAHYSQLGV